MKKWHSRSTGPMYLLYDQNRCKELAFFALKRNFRSRAAFDKFLGALSIEFQRKFLFLATQYLFFVKCANCSVALSGNTLSAKCVRTTYKYIALFALMEAVQTEEYEDFPTYLLRKNGNVSYPINDKSALQSIYAEYNSTQGSVKKVKRFLESLPDQMKKGLERRFLINNRPSDMGAIADFLYNVRSKFIHQAQIVFVANNSPFYTVSSKKVYLSCMRLSDLTRAFEKGLIKHFRSKPQRTVHSK